MPQLASERMTLGQNGPTFQPMGLGTWSWGDNMTWGYKSGTYTDDDIAAAFQVALDNGITFFDTAEVYGFGKSEQILGRLIKQTTQPVVIASKYFPYPWRLSKRTIKSALTRTLKRLDLPHVDLYQVHWPLHVYSLEKVISGMADMVEAGLTKQVGVSNYNLEQTKQAQSILKSRGLSLASNQVEFSLIKRTPETTGLLDYCKEQDSLR